MSLLLVSYYMVMTFENICLLCVVVYMMINTSTREITTLKIQPTQVWNLAKTAKVVVEFNGDGQGKDNGSNLLVRFLS